MYISDNLIKALESKQLSGSSVLELAERETIRVVMRACKYNQSKAAVNMGMARGTFRARLKQYFGEEYI